MSTVMTAASAYLRDSHHIGLFLTSDPLGIFAIPNEAEPYRELVEQLGVTGTIVSCAASYARVFYWTSYPDDDEEWNDQWYATGHVLLGISGPLPADLEILSEDAGVGEFGGHLTPYPETDDPLEWVVMAHFPDQAALTAAAAAVRADERFSENGSHRLFESRVTTISGDARPQLLCFLGRYGPSFYESGAPIRDELHQLLAAHGGETHHDALLGP